MSSAMKSKGQQDKAGSGDAGGVLSYVRWGGEGSDI